MPLDKGQINLGHHLEWNLKSIMHLEENKGTMGSKTQFDKLLDLPPEIQETIIRYLPFDNISKIRLVCRHFNCLCSTLLNAEFHQLRITTHQRFQSIKAQMPRRESARRKHPLARESDIIETLHMRLTLLNMTFGKHIERKHCCFFAGEILDEVHRILQYVNTTSNLSRAFKVTDELFDLSTMAMEYFKEHIEPTLPEITYFVTDILDYTPSLSASPKTQLSLLDDSPPSSSCSTTSVGSVTVPSTSVSPAVNKRLRKLRENMKRSNSQVLALKQEMKLARRRVTTQQKQIQALKARFEDYDKKFQNTSRKLNAVLQELSRCKTELQYWRSKSPAAQCSCGKVTPISELKDSENVSIDLEYGEDIISKHQDILDPSEEFKPISAEREGVSGSRYFLVVPACHSTPPDCVQIPSLDPVPPSKPQLSGKYNSISELHAGKEQKSDQLISKACKRKLKLDNFSDDYDDNIVKIAKVPNISTKE